MTIYATILLLNSVTFIINYRNPSPVKVQVEPVRECEDYYYGKDLESCSDFKYYMNEKKENKKFSIKQLFSLRRKYVFNID